MTYVLILDPELVKICAQLVSFLAFSCVDPDLIGFGVPFESFASSWQHRV
ncbi:hypothetical protein [Pseudomonas marginalis]|nr:hypothetical protein [Pseudomonas marginalis]